MPAFCPRELLLLVLALLVSNAAAGLASRLARGLALATAAVLCALAKVASLDSLDMLHYSILQRISFAIVLYNFLFIKSIGDLQIANFSLNIVIFFAIFLQNVLTNRF